MTTIKAYNVDTRDFEYVKQNNTGLLISGGSSGGGDASSANQVSSNLALCTRLDTINTTLGGTLTVDTELDLSGLATIAKQDLMLSNLSSLDISCNNMEVQLDKLTFTSGNLLVRDSSLITELQGSNLAQYTKLGLIADAAEDTLLSVDGISAKLNPLQIQSAQYTIEAVSQFAPDTTPAFTIPPSGISKDEGWYFKNTGTSQPSQLFFYSYLNPAMAVANRQFAYQLNDITMSYCVVRLIATNSAEGLATLGIYTRPTGSGDAVPGFFKSRKVYNIPSTAKLTQGMEVMLYWGVEPSLKLHPGVSRIQLQLATTTGPAVGTEQLAFLSINTDSAALAGNAEYIVSAAGFQFAAELIMNSEFSGESSSQSVGGDASSANQVSSNTAICSRLDSSNGELSNIRVLLSDSINVVNYGLLNDTPQYVPIRASSTGNLFVYDSQTYGELLTLNSQLDGVIDDGAAALKVVGDFYQATQPVEFTSAQDVNLYAGAALTYTQTGASQYSLDVNVNNTDIPVTGTFWQETQPVSIAQMGFTAEDELIVYDNYVFTELQTLNGKITKCDTDNVIISGSVDITSATALSVTESNPITGFALESTLGDIKTQTDKFTFLDEEANLGNLKVIDLALNTQLSQFSFYTNEDTVTDLRVKQMGSVDVRNPVGETLSVSGSVGITADQSVAISGSVQTHCFASQNGTDWHHLASDANGRLNVNARSHDGTGNDITSTAVSGTETYRGLDVVCKGSVSVQNVSTTQLAVKAQQYGSYGNVANNVPSILPSGVTSGVDVSAWSYFVGAYEDYNEATVGDIRLEYSFDNTTYYTLFNTQIFPSGTGPRRANINKQDIPAVNYIRLRNGTSSTLASVTLTLLGGSLS